MPLLSSRRAFLQASLGALASGLLPKPGAAAESASSAASQRPVRIVQPSLGTAGSVWQPLLSRFSAADRAKLPPLEWIVSDPGRMQVQLVSGSIDVGFFGPLGLASLRAGGDDIVLFGPGTYNHSVWLVKADSPYQTPEDLKGRRVATQPETSETYQQARITASLNGLDLKRDFDVLLGAPLANVAAFDRGHADAIIILEPTATRLVAQGARQIARVGDLWQKATGLREDPFLVGLAAQRSWVEQNRQTATELARLFAKANAQVFDTPQVLREIHDEIGVRASETKAIELLPQRMKNVYTSAWNPEVWQGIDRQIDIAVQVNLLARKPARSVYDGVALA